MKPMFPSNKRGISEIIAYVLLISLALGMSILVYNWLRGEIKGVDEDACPDGVSLIIGDFSCDKTSGQLNLTLNNKGLRTIKGFRVKVNDNPKVNMGVYDIDVDGGEIAIAQSVTKNYVFGNITGNKSIVKGLSYLTIQPMVEDQYGDKIYCKNVIATQSLSCY